MKIINRFVRFLPFFLLSQLVQAEELDPRSYINIPIDQNFLGVIYGYTDGDVFTEAESPYQDIQLEINALGLAYARTFSMFGKSAKFDANLARICVDGQAYLDQDKVTRSYCGYTDARFRLNYNFYGAPALSLTDYVKHKKQIVAGASIQVSAPTGNYDTDYIFNTGSNRWFIKPEIGVSIPYKKWEFDFAIGVKYFTDNDELQKVNRFEQDPIYNIQAHLIYDISPGQWIAFNSNYFDGGDTYVNGEKGAIKAGNYRAGITYSLSLSSQMSIKFLANTGVTTKYGNDSDAYALALAYRW
ncbi:transporter [Catenovulum sp. SM1970]|uniref:transporter n=1 Tax=Marinifaba aquimaris TaxID=2741323 RepID=UPI0015732536|nr:transporter [Marinifaba aquimaris]NTS77833.1 transporter [Marinifaba aquimaris]